MKNRKDIFSATIVIVILTLATGCALNFHRNYYHNSTIYKLKKHEPQFFILPIYLIDKWS